VRFEIYSDFAKVLMLRASKLYSSDSLSQTGFRFFDENADYNLYDQMGLREFISDGHKADTKEF
jgi:hypothetical protein